MNDLDTPTLLKELIGSYGFPIAVTAFLLYERMKFNSKIAEALAVITAYIRLEQEKKGAA